MALTLPREKLSLNTMYAYSSENNAPEVVHHSDLIHVPNDMESPEALQPAYSHLPYHSKSSSDGGAGYSSEKESSPLHTAVPGGELPFSRASSPAQRRRLIWIVIAAVFVALAVGLGVGLGIGLQHEDASDNARASTTLTPYVPAILTPRSVMLTSSNRTSTTSTFTTTATASATTSAVTSGSTGLAEFSCTGGATTESSDGTKFIQECYTMYPGAGPSYYYDTDNVTVRNLGGKNTVYSLEACLDTCDNYNSDGNTPACMAVSYYANLSAPIDLFGGNCFLKNDRGIGRNTDAVDWHHTLSAYRSCLNVTCSGAN